MVEGQTATPTPMVNPDDGSDADRLFAVLYEDLHRIAERELRRNSGATLSPTTLLHEAFLDGSVRECAALADRKRFMAYASRAMRGLIIDSLRRNNAQKRGGEFEFISFPEELHETLPGAVGVERLREALEALARMDARLAECVDLKFFCGFSLAEIARMQGVSERTVQRHWQRARLLLYRSIAP